MHPDAETEQEEDRIKEKEETVETDCERVWKIQREGGDADI